MIYNIFLVTGLFSNNLTPYCELWFLTSMVHLSFQLVQCLCKTSPSIASMAHDGIDQITIVAMDNEVVHMQHYSLMIKAVCIYCNSRVLDQRTQKREGRPRLFNIKSK